jgi:hypothetical protein
VLGSPEGEPKVFAGAFMPLRSFAPGGSCPDTAACPNSCRPHAAVLPPPALTLTSHLEMLPRPAFFVALHAATSPAGCWFANSASARVERCSSTASLHSRQPRSPPHPPVSNFGSWRAVPCFATKAKSSTLKAWVVISMSARCSPAELFSAATC